MELDLDALQALPVEEEECGNCKRTCSATCPQLTCVATTTEW